MFRFCTICTILLVIVKFMALPGHVAQGKTGKRMNMRLWGFSFSHMCHFATFCAISRRVPVVASAGGGSRLGIVWYMRSSLSNQERVFAGVRVAGSNFQRNGKNPDALVRIYLPNDPVHDGRAAFCDDSAIRSAGN